MPTPPSADWDEMVPIRIKALLQECESPDLWQRAFETATKQIVERDEYEALEEAAPDLIRLDRYERRAWSRQKRAIRDFMNITLMRRIANSMAPEGTPVPASCPASTSVMSSGLVAENAALIST
jgi:hypothetical protein